MSRPRADRRPRRDRVVDAGFVDYLQQRLDEGLARRAAMATVTVLPKRLPAGPLVALVEGRGGLYACLGRHRGHDADRLDRAYRRACSQGYMSWKAADRLAIELLGLHPWLIWGEAWFKPVPLSRGRRVPLDQVR